MQPTSAFHEARRVALGDSGFAPHEERGFLYAPLEVLVAGPGHAEVARSFRDAPRRAVADLDVSVYTVPRRPGLADADMDLDELIEDFNNNEGIRRDARASRQYVFSAEPVYHGGPFGWAEAPTDADGLPEPSGVEGDGVTVAVLDTGLVDDAPRWLKDRCSAGYDVEEIEATRDGWLRDATGHGTFVAGVLVQRAPSAAVHVARVLDSNGYTTEEKIAARLCRLADDVRTRGAELSIVNLSLGGYTDGDHDPGGLRIALDRLQAASPGCIFVAAAGNDGKERKMWPAAFSSKRNDVIAVGALAGTAPASFSNRGSWVNAWRPGHEVRSTFVHFDETAVGLRTRHKFQGVAIWSGTSFAAPYFAGEIAAAMTRERHSTARAAARALLATPG